MLGPLGDDTNKLLNYLIKVCPASFEAKSDLGHTPLFLACLMGRVQFAKTLIDAGANQSVKDKESNNIIHACLTNKAEPHQLRQMLELFEPELRAHMFRQRNNLSLGGDTPLHFWFKNANPLSYEWDYSGRQSYRVLQDEDLDNVKILSLLLEFSKGEELEILNGSGDTVLHTAVVRSLAAHTRELLDQNSTLLYRENTVGRTPGEIAYDIFINSKVERVEPIEIEATKNIAKTLVEKRPASFAPGAQPQKSRKNATWDVVQEYLAKTQGKRRLVSLNEANDVAKRLGESYMWQRYYTKKTRNTEDDPVEEANEEEEVKELDFVSARYSSNSGQAWKMEVEEA